MVLMTEEFKVPDSLQRSYRKALKDPRWRFRFNTAFGRSHARLRGARKEPNRHVDHRGHQLMPIAGCTA